MSDCKKIFFRRGKAIAALLDDEIDGQKYPTLIKI